MARPEFDSGFRLVKNQRGQITGLQFWHNEERRWFDMPCCVQINEVEYIQEKVGVHWSRSKEFPWQ